MDDRPQGQEHVAILLQRLDATATRSDIIITFDAVDTHHSTGAPAAARANLISTPTGRSPTRASRKSRHPFPPRQTHFRGEPLISL